MLDDDVTTSINCPSVESDESKSNNASIVLDVRPADVDTITAILGGPLEGGKSIDETHLPPLPIKVVSDQQPKKTPDVDPNPPQKSFSVELELESIEIKVDTGDGKDKNGNSKDRLQGKIWLKKLAARASQFDGNTLYRASLETMGAGFKHEDEDHIFEMKLQQVAIPHFDLAQTGCFTGC